MTDDEFKAIQSADGVIITYPDRETLTASAINEMYVEACKIGEIDKDSLGIPSTAWEKQARALDDAGLITVTGPDR